MFKDYSRRYFRPDFISSVLSHYRNRNSSALRGSIPLEASQIAILDQRMEILLKCREQFEGLRASSQSDFGRLESGFREIKSKARPQWGSISIPH
jgi:oxysterol-binding protein-related protein 3/6/7